MTIRRIDERLSARDGRLVVAECEPPEPVRESGALWDGFNARLTFPREVASREVA